MERAAKLTTTASRRIAGAKGQIGEVLCAIARKKNQRIRKKYYVTRKLLMPVNKIKAITAICFAKKVSYKLIGLIQNQS